jgi:hypothetical protein
MGSAAQWRGAYGGEYLRAELRLRARGGRRKAKKTSQTSAKESYIKTIDSTATDQKSDRSCVRCLPFYRHPRTGVAWSAGNICAAVSESILIDRRISLAAALAWLDRIDSQQCVRSESISQRPSGLPAAAASIHRSIETVRPCCRPCRERACTHGPSHACVRLLPFLFFFFFLYSFF